MAVTTTNTNKPINPRGDDKSPLAFNRAKIYSGKALDFDGVNDSIDVASTIGIENTSFSIITNVLVDSASGSFRLFQNRGTGSAGNVAGIQLSGIPQAGKYNWSNTYVDDGAGNFLNLDGNLTEFDLDKWYNLSLTWDTLTGTMKFYLNGVLVDTKVNTDLIGADLDGPENWIVGGASSTQFLNGQVSNLKAFNTALTAAQVLDLYNNPEKIVPTGVDNTALKLWLPMMEGAGTTAYDGSGNGNHGTISGATWTHGVGAPVAQTAVIDWNKGTNLFTYSNDFSQSDWKTTSGSSFVGGQSGYDGSSDAWLFTDSGAVSGYGAYQDKVINGVHTYSIYVKEGSTSTFVIDSFQSPRPSVTIDLTNGNVTASNEIDAKSELISNGWYRLSLTFNASSTLYMRLGCNGAGSVYIQNAQLESASTAGPYVLTLSTAQSSEVLIPQSLTSGRDLFYNLFENVRKQYALNLDGQSWAEVHDNESLDVTTGLSLEGWVYVDVSKDIRGALIGKYKFTQSARAYSLELDDLTLKFILSSNGSSTTSVQGSTTISTTGWYHFVSTYDESNIKVYLNGAEDNTQAYSGGIYAQDYPVTIGVLDTASQATSIMKDQIAQPRIYNRALTADEVEQNYNAGKNTYS